MAEVTWNGDAPIQPVRQQEHVRLCEKVGHIEASIRQLRICDVAGGPELVIRTQWGELGQWDDRVHVLGRLVPEFVGWESERERRAPVKSQLDHVIEMAVEGLQDEERIIHEA